jgi:hypothetical protein
MNIVHNDITYEVKALNGWDHYLYDALTGDIVIILANHYGVKTANFATAIEQAPNLLTLTFGDFTKFCLSTKASDGIFSDFNISQLDKHKIVKAYLHWLDLCSNGLYDLWLNAYMAENKEEPDQKKEQTGE